VDNERRKRKRKEKQIVIERASKTLRVEKYFGVPTSLFFVVIFFDRAGWGLLLGRRFFYVKRRDTT
jgi:hypothetical protein